MTAQLAESGPPRPAQPFPPEVTACHGHTVGLSEMDRSILALERDWYTRPGAKVTAILGLGVSPVRYYQRLNVLLDHPAALHLDPVTVHRLRRLRAYRLTSRARSGAGLS